MGIIFIEPGEDLLISFAALLLGVHDALRLSWAEQRRVEFPILWLAEIPIVPIFGCTTFIDAFESGANGSSPVSGRAAVIASVGNALTVRYASQSIASALARGEVDIRAGPARSCPPAFIGGSLQSTHATGYISEGLFSIHVPVKT